MFSEGLHLPLFSIKVRPLLHLVIHHAFVQMFQPQSAGSKDVLIDFFVCHQDFSVYVSV